MFGLHVKKPYRVTVGESFFLQSCFYSDVFFSSLNFYLISEVNFSSPALDFILAFVTSSRLLITLF
jgi:hypothetical protein